MNDSATWLEHLGLERYYPAFTENEVEFSDLPDLTEDDLREIATLGLERYYPAFTENANSRICQISPKMI